MVDSYVCSVTIKIFCFQVSLICLPAMTSAWIFKVALRNDTQVSLISQSSFFQFVYVLSTSNFSNDYLTSPIQSQTAGTTEVFLLHELTAASCTSLIIRSIKIFLYQYMFINFIDINFHCFEILNNSLNSIDSDCFNEEQSSIEMSPQGNNYPEILNSTELSGASA